MSPPKRPTPWRGVIALLILAPLLYRGLAHRMYHRIVVGDQPGDGFRYGATMLAPPALEAQNVQETETSIVRRSEVTWVVWHILSGYAMMYGFLTYVFATTGTATVKMFFRPPISLMLGFMMFIALPW